MSTDNFYFHTSAENAPHQLFVKEGKWLLRKFSGSLLHFLNVPLQFVLLIDSKLLEVMP